MVCPQFADILDLARIAILQTPQQDLNEHGATSLGSSFESGDPFHANTAISEAAR
jgi:hypothetical protein